MLSALAWFYSPDLCWLRNVRHGRPRTTFCFSLFGWVGNPPALAGSTVQRERVWSKAVATVIFPLTKSCRISQPQLVPPSELTTDDTTSPRRGILRSVRPCGLRVRAKDTLLVLPGPGGPGHCVTLARRCGSWEPGRRQRRTLAFCCG